MNYCFLFGYAKSGKSTFLSRQDYVIDTSGFMYVMAEKLGRTDVLDARVIKDTSPNEAMALNARQHIIDFVENYLIKYYFGSRRAFVQAAFRHYNDLIPMDCNSGVWVSTINMEEFELLLDCLSFNDDYSVYNLRRNGELPGSDSRELHPNADCTITATMGEFFFKDEPINWN
jgi:hypothetical protein